MFDERTGHVPGPGLCANTVHTMAVLPRHGGVPKYDATFLKFSFNTAA
jgi:hypothetical protein